MRTSTAGSPLSLSSTRSSTATSCIDGILRRVVCGGFAIPAAASAVTAAADARDRRHPSDSAPGIVARLMGLDDVPPRGDRRMSASAALLRFLETPTFLTQENDEFLILSFGSDLPGGGSRKARRSRAAESKARLGSDDSSSSQNSSPVSVLGCSPASRFIDIPHCRDEEEDEEEVDELKKRRNSRRKLSSEIEASPTAAIERCRCLRRFPEMWRAVRSLVDEDAIHVKIGAFVSREIGSELSSVITDLLLLEVVADLCRDV